MKLFAGVALLTGIAFPYSLQSTDTLSEMLDLAVRRSVPSAVLERFQPPSFHGSETYLAWRYAEDVVSVQYGLAASLDEARDRFAKNAMGLSVPTMPVEGLVGDEAFVVAPVGDNRRLHFRRGRFHVQVTAPARALRCVLTDAAPAPCLEPPDPLIGLPAPRNLNGREIVSQGFETVVRFAVLFDAKFSKTAPGD
jgi:hypothetical protein